jgi:CxxC motif-containing protein (DUF1111 family)
VKRILALLALFVLTGAAPYENGVQNGEAFTQPIAGLGEFQAKSFRAGSSLFRQAWVIGPSQDHPDVQGLGPLYNRLSCIACHVKNGRGAAPDDENGVLRSIVVRLGVSGADAHGGPLPHPVYGDQLNPEGVPVVPGEGRGVIDYDAFDIVLSDGSAVPMRRPRLSFRDLAYGPLEQDVKTSVRMAPPVFGLGLLEAVPDEIILAQSAESKGRPNYVWDITRGARVLGRFGLKANQPSLEQQIANAFASDIGITSTLFPLDNCTAPETACAAAARRERQPELSASQLAATVDYIRALAPPARRDTENARIKSGEALFASLGCATCHRDSLKLGSFPPVPGLSGTTIHPYTDLLLHDMGEGLADGRDDFEAGPRDWRTPPLWGLGLAGKYGDAANFLHDGRARTLAEAILWHGGDAKGASDGFRRLERPDREALLAFLNSL